MEKRRHLFTSESVGKGHPDKIADQISDAVLDALFEQDPMSRVACETLVTTGTVFISGEITTQAHIDYAEVARQMIREIGYTDPELGFSADACGVMVAVHQQSPDISQGVTPGGAGDQGLMFGMACNETPELMPMPIMLAHRLVRKLAEARENGEIEYLRPDAKSQVTVEYENMKPVRVHTVVISAQHDPDVSYDTIRADLIEKIAKAVIPAEMLDDKTIYHINPTGRFVLGGPHADTGLTGRKIIVDTYGGSAPHGGGAFSGKDPTKVDRSASYAVRWVAKNIVAAGIADRCTVQVSYAIGIADPLSILVSTDGTGKVPDGKIEEAVKDVFDLRPQAIIEQLNLRRPIYRATAAGGHFGLSDDTYTWERTDKVDDLRSALGL